MGSAIGWNLTRWDQTSPWALTDRLQLDSLVTVPPSLRDWDSLRGVGRLGCSLNFNEVGREMGSVTGWNLTRWDKTVPFGL